jgi:hypothetical protein
MCRNELNEPGALLFSEPYLDGEVGHVKKIHLCSPCSGEVYDFINENRQLER